MQPAEEYAILADTLLILIVFVGPRVRITRSQLSSFLYENPGAPLVLAFVALLLSAAVFFSLGNLSEANLLSEIAYFMILGGVALQALSAHVQRLLDILRKKLIIDSEEFSTMKCPRCGYENPPEAKYCLNCGFRLVSEERVRFEGEGLLLVSGGLISLLVLLFNTLLHLFISLTLAYLVLVLTSLYSGFRLYRGSVSLAVIALSSVSIIIGFSVGMFLYLLGLGLKGLVSPDWVIYLLAAYKMYADRKKFSV
ncbi:MAG: zinc ribbon domain-containing protein [Nitrososphaeria archaeon]